MDHQREDFLRRLEDHLSRLLGWLASRRRAGEQAPGPLHSRVEALRRDVSRVRRATAEEAHDVVARAQATLDDMERDPGWRPAHEEYDRSWDEIHRAFEEGSDTPAIPR